MAQFTFVTANDIHIMDTTPRSRVDDYRAAILNKLEQMGAVCRELNVDAAIIAGDLFNAKEPLKNSHGMVRELIRVFGQFNCPVYMIEGNHDLLANNLQSINTQPLGVLFEDGTLIRMREHIIEDDGVKVSLVGIPYQENLDLTTLKIPPKGDAVAQICAMHLYASPTPGMLFKERIYGYRELVDLGPDVFVIGHYHLDQGVRREKEKWFINIGSISRGSLTDEHLDHKPQIGVITVVHEEGKTTIVAKPIKLKVKSAETIFNLKKREEEQKESKEIEKFVEKLIAESVTAASSDQDRSIEDVVKELNAAQEVKDRVLHFIHEATAARKT